MFLEDFTIRSSGSSHIASSEPCHDFTKDRSVILRLQLTLDPLDAEAPKVLAQSRERALMEKTGQVVGRIGEKLAAPQPDEEIEELPPHAFNTGPGRGFS